MFHLSNTNILISSGAFLNCSTQNFTIFTIDNSSFYLKNTHVYDFHSLLLYSSLGFINIDNCFFSNLNSTSLGKDYVIRLANNVSFIFNSSLFEDLKNFSYVINKNSFNQLVNLNR